MRADRRGRSLASPTMSSDPRELPVPTLWRQPIDQWCQAQAAAGRTAETIRTRRDQLHRAARALDGSPWNVTGDQLVTWAGRQEWARETRRSVYAGVRSFYRWAAGCGHVEESPADALPRVRASDPCPRPTPDDVTAQAIASADPRTWLVLRLAAEAGLRRAEIAQVHADDLTRDLAGWTLLCHGKGDKLRLVPLEDGLADAVRAACRRGHGWAFPGVVGGHLSPQWVGKLAARVLPDGWTLHSLRHRFATRAYWGTGDLLAVQQLLGHASVATTQRYVQPPRDALRAAVRAAA